MIPVAVLAGVVKFDDEVRDIEMAVQVAAVSSSEGWVEDVIAQVGHNCVCLKGSLISW